MFLKFILFEQYYFILMFLHETGTLQKQRISFIIESLAIFVGIRCIIKSFMLLKDCFESYVIFVRGVTCKILSVGTHGAIKMPYDDETMEKHYLVVSDYLKKMSLCCVIYFIGFVCPNLLPLDSTAITSDFFKSFFTPTLMGDLIILYVFFTIRKIYREIDMYLVCDAYLYFEGHFLFNEKLIPPHYKKFYDYFKSVGCDSHEAVKRTAIFRISMNVLPLLGLIAGYCIA